MSKKLFKGSGTKNARAKAKNAAERGERERGEGRGRGRDGEREKNYIELTFGLTSDYKCFAYNLHFSENHRRSSKTKEKTYVHGK